MNNNFNFENINGDITLVSYNGDDKKVIIPETFEGEPVTVIGGGAFNHNNKVENIVLPKTIKLIKGQAFGHCGIKSIELPEGLLEMKQYAFCGCYYLQEVTFPESLLNVPPRSFFGCSSLKRVVAKNINTKFSPTAFTSCNELEDVSFCIIKILPIEVQVKLMVSLLNKANLSKDENLEIASFIMSKKKLLNELFMSVDTKTITFLLDNGAKLSLDMLDEYMKKSIENNNISVNAILIDYKNKNFTKIALENHENDKDLLDIGLKPPTKKQIDEYDFEEDEESLIELILSTIEKFDSYDKKDQKSFISIIKTRKKLKHLLFDLDNPDLINFLLKQGVTLSLKEVNNYTKKSIKYDNTAITAILLEYKEKNISKEELQQEKDIKEQQELVDIGFELPNIKQLKEQWSVGKITGGLRISGYKGENTNVTIPGEIDDNTPIIALKSNTSYNFTDFTAIEHLTISENIITIDIGTFNSCKKLTTVNLPNSLKSIGNMAFCYCEKLKTIDLPQGLEILGYGVFYKCESLEEITIPNSLIKLSNTYGVEGIFFNCTKLKSVILPEDALEEFNLIPAYAFANCSNLVSINIPKSIRKINTKAFLNCKSLEKIIIPDTVEKIDVLAFEGCTKLKEVIISQNTKVNKSAFTNCPLLR